MNGYSVLAWQGARKELGSHYALMASSNPFYIETHDQRQQVKMLFKERVDIIQLDKQIFEFYRASLITEKEIDENITVDSFSLFKKSPNGFMFRHSKARDDFVKQIELMRMNGRYSAIFNKYI